MHRLAGPIRDRLEKRGMTSEAIAGELARLEQCLLTLSGRITPLECRGDHRENDAARDRWEADAAGAECVRLRVVLRQLHREACEAEEAGDYVLAVQERLGAEIESWAERGPLRRPDNPKNSRDAR